MRHWFLDTDQISLTEILSSERDPSPDDGGTTEGTRTWYSYTNANAIDIASNLQISCIAQILPDGTSQYTRYQYYSTGLVSQNEQSYSLPGGGIGVAIHRSAILFYKKLKTDSSLGSGGIQEERRDRLPAEIGADGLMHPVIGGALL
jgi:hypothetical protein